MIYEINDIKLASHSVVCQSAHDFAHALEGTQQYTAFLSAVERLKNDQEAHLAMAAFQEKQKSLQMSSMSGEVGSEDQAELERLHQAFVNRPSVEAYFQAQDDLMAICQEAAQHLSRTIGINYPSACSAGCCG